MKGKKKIILILLLLLILGAGVLHFSDLLLEYHQLEIELDGEGQTIPEPGIHEYEDGEEIEIIAEPEQGWRFVEWTGDIVSDNRNLEFNIEEDIYLKANFVREEFSLDLDFSAERGEVKFSPDQEYYKYEEQVTLKAVPEEGYEFTRWQGDLEGDEKEKKIEISRDLEIAAVFEPKSYTLTAHVRGEGEINWEVIDIPENIDIENEQGTIIDKTGLKFPAGTRISLEAIPGEDWEFTGWFGDFEQEDREIEIELHEDTDISALMTHDDYIASPDVFAEHGEIKIQPEEDIYEKGQEVEIEAIPDTGFKFERWQGDLEGDEPEKSFEIHDEKLIEAVFERVFHDVLVTIEGNGDVEWDFVEIPENVVKDEKEGMIESYTELSFPHDSLVRFEAFPDPGNKFVGWGEDIENEDEILEVEIKEDLEITAEFESQQYIIEFDYDTDRGEVLFEPDRDYYYYGDEVQIEAVPEEGFQFTGWGGDLEGEDPVKTVVVDENITVEAGFDWKRYSLEVSYDEERGRIDLSPDRTTYHHGESVTVEAKPESGWEFREWRGDLEGEEPEIDFEMRDDMEIEAAFVPEDYEFLLEFDEDKGKISIDPEKDYYQKGDQIFLTAEAREGYTFERWYGDIEGEDPEISLEVKEDMKIGAEFVPARYELDVIVMGDGEVNYEPEKDDYEYGEEIKIEARPELSWEFLRWSGDLSGRENPKTFIITEDMTVEVRFRFEK